jgi:hypothetical protein
MERSDAEKISLLVNEMFDRINQVLFIVNNSTDVAPRKNTQMALGKVIAELDLEILEPIYKQFPELRPPDIEEIKS